MGDVSGERLRKAAGAAPPGGGAGRAAAALISALDSAPSAEIALLDTFAQFMEAVAQTYFDRPWNEEHQFNLFARLTDDARAWGYGSESEIEPLRWLWEVSGCWFDGAKLRDADSWQEDFDAWADGQQTLVRRMTPGALDPDTRLRP